MLRYLRCRHAPCRFQGINAASGRGDGHGEDRRSGNCSDARRGLHHVSEACRPVSAGNSSSPPAGDDWVMFYEDPALREDGAARHNWMAAPVAFSPRTFPHDRDSPCLDLRRNTWRPPEPFSSKRSVDRGSPAAQVLAHPLVSAAMILETFMESARILYPHLQVLGVRQVRFLDMISCPPEVPVFQNLLPPSRR